MVGLYINRINSKVENVHHTWLFVQILHKDENEKLKTNFIILNQTEYKHPHARLQVLNTRKLTQSL
jgi:hypothetical protein